MNKIMASDMSVSRQNPTTHSTGTLGQISEVASLYSMSRNDIDSLSLSSNSGGTPTSSSSSFKTINTYRLADTYPMSYSEFSVKKNAVLAEAEDMDDIDDIIEHNVSISEEVENLNVSVPSQDVDCESMDKSNSDFVNKNSNQIGSDSPNVSSDCLNKKINDIKQTLIMSGSTSMPTVTSKSNSAQAEKLTVLTPLEKVSDEAKKYWATLDLYNNSKVAFNKRSKSVRLKREKLNSEWQSRFQMQTQTQTPQKQQPNSSFKSLEETPQQKHDPETCKCVKCSIIYHETLIKSVSDMKGSMCRKCSSKLVACKCCTSSSSSMASFSDTASSVSSGDTKKTPEIERQELATAQPHDTGKVHKNNEFNRFEEKLFNIKNELVNLSETSLDVFQLLLQLSDTMLELNTQLNRSDGQSMQSSSQLLFINQLLSSNLNLSESLDSTKTKQLPETNKPPTASNLKQQKSQRIEDFLSKTLTSVGSSSNTMSPMCYSTNQYNITNNNHLKLSNSDEPLTEHDVGDLDEIENPIDNMYDKTSVMQFVDSFFSSSKGFSEASGSSRNSGYYSLLSTLNKNNHYTESDFIIDNENPYQTIDDDLMSKVESFSHGLKPSSAVKYQVLKNTSKHDSPDTASIISDALSLSSNQSSLNRNTQQSKSKQSQLTHSSSNNSQKNDNSSSSSSSSSGCIEGTGSSSISSSSNIDLSSLPSNSSSSTNITNETSHMPNSSTSNSLVLSDESQTINRRLLMNNDYNKVTDNLIQSYRHVINEPSAVLAAKNDTKRSTIPELPLSENKIAQAIKNDPIYGSSQRSNSYKSAASIYGTHVANQSTRRNPSFKFDSNILSRVQRMGQSRHDSIEETETLGSVKSTPTVVVKSNHQISLDSGIYVPGETDS